MEGLKGLLSVVHDLELGGTRIIHFRLPRLVLLRLVEIGVGVLGRLYLLLDRLLEGLLDSIELGLFHGEREDWRIFFLGNQPNCGRIAHLRAHVLGYGVHIHILVELLATALALFKFELFRAKLQLLVDIVHIDTAGAILLFALESGPRAFNLVKGLLVLGEEL